MPTITEKPVTLTAAQAETIRRVLREGGNVGLTKGSLTFPRRRLHYVNKTTAARLVQMGLLEGKPLCWFAGSYRPDDQNEPQHHRVYATAKGCVALNAYETAHAVA